MNLLTKIYQVILPNKEQLVNQAIDWNKDRLNDWISQFLATAIILPVAFLVAKTMIRPCPVEWLLMKLIYELAVQTAIIAPMMSGYFPLKKKLSNQLLKIDLVEKGRQLLNWWKQPSNYPLLSMIGVISGYTMIYKYQEWIGLTLGGLIIHQILKISLYSMMLIYSNLLFNTILQFLKDRRQEKECNQMLQRSWIMMDDDDDENSNSDSFINLKELMKLAEQQKPNEKKEEAIEEKSLTEEAVEEKSLMEEAVEKDKSLTEKSLADSSIASDGQKVMLDFSLSGSFNSPPKSKDELSESMRTRIQLFENFQSNK